MIRSAKQIRREAKHLFGLCRTNGSLDEKRVRQVVKGILESKRRGRLAIAKEFDRLLRLEQLKHTAEVYSATPLPNELQADVQANLNRMYGSGIATSFKQSPELIGGMRIRVGDDVYDGSIKAELAALERSF